MNSKLISRGSKKEKKNSKITEDYLRQKGFYLFMIIYLKKIYISLTATTQKITVDDVLQLTDATNNFLIGIEKNVYDIEFTRFILEQSTEYLLGVYSKSVTVFLRCMMHVKDSKYGFDQEVSWFNYPVFKLL